MSALTSSRTVKDALYQQLARIGKAVSSPQRLALLDRLSNGEKPVEALAAEVHLSVKNASAHLRVLREARLVEPRKDGQYVYYRLAEEGVAAFFLALRDLAERRLAEVREVSLHYLGGRRQMTPVDRRQLLARIRSGEVTVLDLRDKSEFAAGHIPGARSVPLGELKKALRSVPRDQEVVAYCHGPYCVLSLEAVQLLTAKGYRATRLDDGFVEWAAAGLPVERGRAGARPD
ncbi:MAG TPA: metalloregulator ArsR/SmtB family transcription factor [Gemmatimonadales bacterium]|nr:metalloregulator ArsR/SmtB family transcription factor [Gemmatimonadales bacterium]